MNETADISHLDNFLVPARELNAGETAVWRSTAYQYSKLNGAAQKEAYALALTGKLQDYMQALFIGLQDPAWARVEQVRDPRGREMAETFTAVTMNQTARIMAGLQLSASQQFNAIVTEPLPEMPTTRPGFWARVLGGAA
jgi:hypothetical protein